MMRSHKCLSSHEAPWSRNIVTVYRVRLGHDTDIRPCSLPSPLRRPSPPYKSPSRPTRTNTQLRRAHAERAARRPPCRPRRSAILNRLSTPMTFPTLGHLSSAVTHFHQNRHLLCVDGVVAIWDRGVDPFPILSRPRRIAMKED